MKIGFILKDIGLNEVDKWCLGNCSLKIDSKGKCSIVKIDGMQSRRIDGADSLVILQEIFNRYKTDLVNYL